MLTTQIQMMSSGAWYLWLGIRILVGGSLVLVGTWFIHTLTLPGWLQICLDMLILVIAIAVGSGPITYGKYRELATKVESCNTPSRSQPGTDDGSG